MIEIHEALQLIADRARTLQPEYKTLRDLAGSVLATDVISDVDSPPFDKSMMDGFAIRSADFAQGLREFEVVADVVAGMSFDGVVQSGQAVRIMTGAPIPDGADAVVMVEETSESESEGNQQITLRTANIRDRQNILTRATAMAVGETIITAGRRIRGEDIGILAEAGAYQCQVFRKPDLAVLATGDELVDASSRPSANQIRNSNGPMLASLAGPLCGHVNDLGIAGDNRESLTELIEQGLDCDVLVLSGGVSAGTLDLVPSVLQHLGVQQVFHKVKIKPGKPVWFGIRQKSGEGSRWVFGLPGNPVSSMVCFHVFVAPLLMKLAGRQWHDGMDQGRLATAHKQRSGRTTYWPSRLNHDAEGPLVEPLPWKGSADLKTLAAADCFAVFDGQREEFEAGETLAWFPMSCGLPNH